MRCFVALVPPQELQDAVSDWSEEALGPIDGVRAVSAESLHVTLAFLGEIEEERTEIAAELVRGVESRPVRIRLGSVLSAVPHKRPRVLALVEEAGDAAPLQREVASALVGAGLLEPERRPFWSHLTVARVKRGMLRGNAGKGVIAAVPAPGGAGRRTHYAKALTLYRSELGKGPASYTALATLDLPDGGL